MSEIELETLKQEHDKLTTEMAKFMERTRIIGGDARRQIAHHLFASGVAMCAVGEAISSLGNKGHG